MRGTNSYSLFTIHYSLFTPAYTKAPAGRIHYLSFETHCCFYKPPAANRLLPAAPASIPE